MAPGVFTRDEIEIREFKNGRCVLEASGNSSSSSTRCVLRRIPVADLLYLTYTVENEPFEKLPISYKPVQRSGPHAEFRVRDPRRVDPVSSGSRRKQAKKLSARECFHTLQT